jgi:hypothetical protein
MAAMYGEVLHIEVEQIPYFVDNSDDCAMKHDTFRKWVRSELPNVRYLGSYTKL